MKVDIEAEIARAHREGVISDENLPFLFEPQQDCGEAILLVHGFCASPYEMRPLGKHLASLGFLCLGVRLAGHGTCSEDLRGRTWQEWLASVECGYQLLAASGRPISLLSQSTGALLGLQLARTRQLQRCALLSPFLKLRHPLSGLTWLLKHVLPYQHRDLAGFEKPFYYERRPLAGIEQLGKLSRATRPLLPAIDIPALVLASEGDLVVARGTGRKLFEGLGSRTKSFHLFGPEVPHSLSTPENPRFAEVRELVSSFFLTPDRNPAR